MHARQPLVVVEAMKMENELRASRDGRVADVAVRDGQSVEAGTLLVVLDDVNRVNDVNGVNERTAPDGR